MEILKYYFKNLVYLIIIFANLGLVVTQNNKKYDIDSISNYISYSEENYNKNIEIDSILNYENDKWLLINQFYSFLDEEEKEKWSVDYFYDNYNPHTSYLADSSYLRKFDCKGFKYSGHLMNPIFLLKLKEAEYFYGREFKINSGFRTPKYQRFLRFLGYQAAEYSTHTIGCAVDINTLGYSTSRLVEALKKVGITRFGYSRSFLHVDIGDYIEPNTWVADVNWIYEK